jgi:hypothetical protein
MQMALLANINRDRKKHPQPFAAKEFLPEWTTPEVERDVPTDDEIRAAVQAMNKAFGGRVNEA